MKTSPTVQTLPTSQQTPFQGAFPYTLDPGIVLILALVLMAKLFPAN